MKKLLYLIAILPLYSLGMELENVQTKRQFPCLHYAAKYAKLAMCQQLINHGWEVNAKDRKGCTPLHVLFLNRPQQDDAKVAQIASILLRAGADINSLTDGYNNTPLHLAARANLPTTCKVLLDYNPNLTISNKYDATPLAWASKCKCTKAYNVIKQYQPFPHKEILTLLMIHRLRKNSPLSWVPKDVLKYLIIPRAWPKRTFKWMIQRSSPIPKGHFTWLHYATFWCKPQMVQRLLNRSRDVNARNKDGLTPLHLLFLNKCRYDDDTIIANIASMLLKNGADVNSLTADYRNTPLHLAARKDLAQTCKVLLEYGADTTLRNTYEEDAGLRAITFGSFRAHGVIEAYESAALQNKKNMLLP